MSKASAKSMTKAMAGTMTRAMACAMAYDLDDDEVVYPKSQRRALHKDETVPHIPTLYEQIDMAGVAASNLKPKPR